MGKAFAKRSRPSRYGRRQSPGNQQPVIARPSANPGGAGRLFLGVTVRHYGARPRTPLICGLTGRANAMNAPSRGRDREMSWPRLALRLPHARLSSWTTLLRGSSTLYFNTADPRVV